MSANKITVVDDQITVQVVEGSVSSAWGEITGTLSNQTDLQAALDAKVDENAAIVGATKTKITYDAKGLVTAGADAAYSDFNFLPAQSGQNGKYLTTDGSTLAWGTVSTANIYNSDGTLTGNRTVTMNSYSLSFTRDVTINGIKFGRGAANELGNTIIGETAFNANTTGQNNTSVGFESLKANTDGASNSAFGAAALTSNTSGYNNSAFGINSLLFNNAGFENTAIGTNAGYNVTTGDKNTFLGFYAGRGITTGNYNTILGGQVNALTNSLSNHIIIQDGQENKRIAINENGNVYLGGTTSLPTFGSQKLEVAGDVKIQTISNATTDTDRFLVSDNGVIKYRTGTEMVSDLGITSANIYNTDGSLTGNRALTLNGSYLRFVGSTHTSQFTSAGRLLLGTTTESSFILDTVGTSRFTGQVTFSAAQTFTDTNGIQLTSSVGSGIRRINIGINNNLSASAILAITIGASNNTSSSGSNYATILGSANTIGVNSGVQYPLIFGSFNNFSPSSLTIGSPSGIIIGNGNVSAYGLSSIFGNNNSATADNQLIFGYNQPNTSVGGFTDVYFGNGVRSTNENLLGKDVTINSSGAGNSTDKTGGNLILAAGKSTGAATAPDVIISTPSVTTSGTTLQSLTQRWWIKGDTGQLANVSSPNASAAMQIDTTSRGFLPPRQTTAQRDAIATPAAGLIVYNTSTNKLCLYDGTNWVDLN